MTKELFKPLISNDISWKIIQLLKLDSIGKLQRVRQISELTKRTQATTARLKIDLENRGLHVLEGPFVGMRYPGFAAVGSTLLPKLLGTYEHELHPFIEELSGMKIPKIVDVGCAEGYYAVGLALRFPETIVRAHDIDPEARRLCAALAERNGVLDRVSVLGACGPDSLLAEDFSEGGLVIADCEGYERQLFNPEVAYHLRRAHVLIELHDYLDRSITPHIQTAFSRTHEVTLVPSTTDEWKVENLRSIIIEGSTPFDRMVAFAEGRREVMDWALIRPRPGIPEAI